MNLLRPLRWLGIALWIVSGVVVVVDRDAIKSVPIWIAAYLVFGWALGAAATVSEQSRAVRVVALSVQIVAMMAMAAVVPCHLGALLLVIVAWQAALLLTPAQSTALIVAQTAVMTVLLARGCALSEGIATMLAILGFQGFAAVSIYVGRREAESRAELSRTNAELLATRVLLEESSRQNERVRIARELHDVLGHDLTALGLQLEVAKNVVDGAGKPHVVQAQEISRRLLADVREVVSTMRGMPSGDLHPALEALACGVPELTVTLDMPRPFMVDDPRRAQCVIRCVQEVLTNTLRHAHAERVFIKIAYDGDAIAIDAHDDGAAEGEIRAGNGLSGMRERLEEMGGRLSVHTADARFSLQAWLPMRGVPS